MFKNKKTKEEVKKVEVVVEETHPQYDPDMPENKQRWVR